MDTNTKTETQGFEKSIMRLRPASPHDIQTISIVSSVSDPESSSSWERHVIWIAHDLKLAKKHKNEPIFPVQFRRK